MIELRNTLAVSAVALCFATTAGLTSAQQTNVNSRTQVAAQTQPTSDLSADRLLGMQVLGVNGQQVGSIENILVRNNRATAIVVTTSGFLDMLDTHVRVPWNEVQFVQGVNHVQVPISEATFDRYAELKAEPVATGPREWRVTEVIGDYAQLNDSATYGLVSDLLIGRDGQVKNTVVRANRSYGGGLFAYPWRTEAFDPGRDAYPMAYNRSQVSNWNRFDYATYGIAAPPRMAVNSIVHPTALRNGISIERLLDMDVRGQNNNSIGEIDNVLVNAQGQITAVVVDSGGFLNVGETHIRIPWNQVRFGPNMEYATVPVSEANIADFNLFSEQVRTGPREWRVTELIDDYAALNDGTQYGIVQDLVVNRDGRVQAVVVGSRAAFGRASHAFAFQSAGFDPGTDTYTLNYDRNQVGQLRPFTYETYAIAAPMTGGARASAGARGMGRGAVGATR